MGGIAAFATIAILAAKTILAGAITAAGEAVITGAVFTSAGEAIGIVIAFGTFLAVFAVMGGVTFRANIKKTVYAAKTIARLIGIIVIMHPPAFFGNRAVNDKFVKMAPA